MAKALTKNSQKNINEFFLFQNNITTAEKYILDLADYLYVHSSLKPMSKVIFFISRIFLILKEDKNVHLGNKEELVKIFSKIKEKYNFKDADSDYDFAKIIYSIISGYDKVTSNIKDIYQLTEGTDSLGLIFNTLIRGRFEAGEGLGTHLTPEEVVRPVTKMCLHIIKEFKSKNSNITVGDITAGTGRFPFSLVQELKHDKKFENNSINYILADQSKLAMELSKINFIINNHGNSGSFLTVNDSLVDDTLYKFKDKFTVLCTNPPFGSNKYQWNPEILNVFPKPFLDFILFSSINHSIDPAELFLFRNLDLLEDNGVLGIVLPDGIVYSERLKTSISFYENFRKLNVVVRAIISLPVATFSLGGTVAKTTFLILQKVKKYSTQELTYVAEAKNVGFLKKGNLRVVDPKGNDLENISNEFINKKEGYGKWKKLIDLTELTPSIFSTQGNFKSDKDFIRLKEISTLIRESEKKKKESEKVHNFHISILDINSVGLLDLLQVRKNNPITKGLQCQPGDILVSCINPKIWRVTVVPDFIDANWTCSSEFAVIRRTDKTIEPLEIFFSLMEKNSMDQIRAMAKGTSSSRQRVKKDDVINIWIKKKIQNGIDFEKFKKNRDMIYKSIWNEILFSDSFFCSTDN